MKPTSRKTASKNRAQNENRPSDSKSKNSQLTISSLKKVSIIYSNLTEITKHQAVLWADVNELDLSNNKILNMSNLSQCQKLINLKLNGNGIKQINGLQNCTELQELHLHGNEISIMTGIESLKRLRYLDLSSNNINKIENLKFIPNITTLKLSHNCIKEIERLEGLQRLEEIYLNDNIIEKLQGLKHLNFGRLNELSLSNNRLYSLKGLNPSMTSLKVLWLNNNSISSLDELPCLPLLRELHVKGNKLSHLTPKDGDNFTSLYERLPNLDLLDIQNNHFENPNEIVSSLKNIEELSVLKVCGNPFCSTLGYEKSFIKKLSNLRLLDDTIIPIRVIVEEDWKSPFQGFFTEMGLSDNIDQGREDSTEEELVEAKKSESALHSEEEQFLMVEDKIISVEKQSLTNEDVQTLPNSPESKEKQEANRNNPRDQIRIPTVEEAQEMYRNWLRENEKWVRRRKETINRLRELNEDIKRHQQELQDPTYVNKSYQCASNTPEYSSDIETESVVSLPDMREKEIIDLMRSSLTSSSGRPKSGNVIEKEVLDLMRSSLTSSSSKPKSSGKIQQLREAQAFSKVYDSIVIEKETKSELERQLKMSVDVKIAHKRGPITEDDKIGYRNFITPKQRSLSRPSSAKSETEHFDAEIM